MTIITLSEIDSLVLIAVDKLHPNAYAVTVQDVVTRQMPFAWMWRIYRSLHRLRDKGLLSSVVLHDVPNRGGYSKTVYCPTDSGMAALARYRQ